ncbi:MAG: cytochrome c maturation protein CcmE [Candidatus Hydrothermarchaeota archaeon]|jgi:cytochrome c-type biogenesis protein CcmE|nr:cytochrome c maturation protein CcmE [Candidatus Hydrothermarchaeota archaeon]
MNKKTKVAIGVAVVLLGLWMSVSAIGDFLNPIKFVSEVTAQPENYLNRNVQVAGLIVQESLQKRSEPNSYVFELTDGNATIKVEYSGSVPVPKVKPGVGVTVIGVLTSEDTLKSNKILLKCPSKYQEELTKAYYREQNLSYAGGAY